MRSLPLVFVFQLAQAGKLRGDYERHDSSPTTAYMTTTVLPRPTRQKLPVKRRDPFVTCWNECYQTGLRNGPKCMDNCLEVSSKTTLFQFFAIFRFFQMWKRRDQVKHHTSKGFQPNSLLFRPALLVCYPRLGEWRISSSIV